MRIVLGSLTYPLPNGVTNSVNLTVDGLLAAGAQVMIVAPDYGLKLARPEHKIIPSSSLGKLFMSLWGKEERMFSWRSRSKMEKLIADFRPDVFWLHQVTWAPNLFEKVMLDSGLPTLLTYHTLVEQYARVYAGTVGLAEAGAERMVNRSKELANAVNQVITPSTVIKDKLIGYGVTTPISVIATGITPPVPSLTKAELAARYKFSPDNALLLFVGRISEEKNIKALLGMARDLKKMQVAFNLMLIGPGDIAETKKQAVQLGISGCVTLTDALPASVTRACYGAADVFVFASQSETQGLVLGEAMMAGLPVVALDSPIQKEIYPEEVAVVVYDQKLFASAVGDLLKDEPRLKLLAANGQKFVTDHFSDAIMTQKQLALIEKLISTS